jgi:hypothetical protein
MWKRAKLQGSLFLAAGVLLGYVAASGNLPLGREVTSAIGLRTAIFPRWMAFIGYALALVMLLTITNFAWIALVFPSWVLLLSAYILVSDIGEGRRGATSAEKRAAYKVGQ